VPAVVWTGGAVGALLRLVMAERFERASIVAYLTLGWCGLILLPRAMQVLPLTSTCLIALGGVLYSAGVIFHLWERLRFQNAIWHAFVLVAATCHYGGHCHIKQVKTVSVAWAEGLSYWNHSSRLPLTSE
jgi:hemolysin III